MKKVKIIGVDRRGSLDDEINMFILSNNYELVGVQMISGDSEALVTYDDREFTSPIRSDRKVLNG